VLTLPSRQTPFAIVQLPEIDSEHKAAKAIISRSILAVAIYELWGEGHDYQSLHEDVQQRTKHLWEQYKQSSFRFEVDSFHGSRSQSQQREIIETFSYMGFEGPIVMKSAQCRLTVFEDYELNVKVPWRLFLGQLVVESGRKGVATYNLKKRKYISTTSMDAELSLVTANLALARPGGLAYDPFMGTGSFPLACAHFGSTVWGSDLDGRSIRGKKGRNVKANFEQYGTSSLYLDGFAADLTNTPLRVTRCLDSIICDPPYGVREGLKVLGSVKLTLQQEVFLADGSPAHLQKDYIPPRRPYSFLRMMDDILDFGANMLVNGGRLCMWMPVAGAVDEIAAEEADGETTAPVVDSAEYAVPQHPCLELASVCQQDFNKCESNMSVFCQVSTS
jgi:tRNA (guanine10-N2)-methyltransferase